MNCPRCHAETKVVDSRENQDGTVIRRRRECLGCQDRVTTYERLEGDPLPSSLAQKSRSLTIAFMRLRDQAEELLILLSSYENRGMESFLEEQTPTPDPGQGPSVGASNVSPPGGGGEMTTRDV